MQAFRGQTDSSFSLVNIMQLNGLFNTSSGRCQILPDELE